MIYYNSISINTLYDKLVDLHNIISLLIFADFYYS